MRIFHRGLRRLISRLGLFFFIQEAFDAATENRREDLQTIDIGFGKIAFPFAQRLPSDVELFGELLLREANGFAFASDFASKIHRIFPVMPSLSPLH